MRKVTGKVRDTEQRELSVKMKRLMTGYRMLLETAIEQEGITLAQLRMLNALNDHAEVSAAELARTCYITPQSMQAVVKRAELAGWITRTASPLNRRVLTATLTRAGRRVLQRGMALSAAIERHIWAGTKPSDLHLLNLTLHNVLQRLQARIDEQHMAHHLKQHAAPSHTSTRRRKTA